MTLFYPNMVLLNGLHLKNASYKAIQYDNDRREPSNCGYYK